MLNQQPTGGKNTVHLSVDPTNRFFVTANYASGKLGGLSANQDSDTIVMFRVARDGTLAATGQVIKTGSPACILFG